MKKEVNGSARAAPDKEDQTASASLSALAKLQCDWAFHSKPRRQNNLCHQHCLNTRPRGVAGTSSTFAIPPQADIRQWDLLVRFVPEPDLARCFQSGGSQ